MFTLLGVGEGGRRLRGDGAVERGETPGFVTGCWVVAMETGRLPTGFIN